MNRASKVNALLCSFALITRIALFLNNRALWLDETLLARNIMARSPLELFQSLAGAQMAPFGFLLALKTSTIFFGPHEWALRLFPFICGIISLGLFFHITKKLPKLTRTLALLFFAISPLLLRYSAEAKQYSVDVMMMLLAVTLVSAWLQNRSWGLLAGIGLFGLVGVWFSHAMPFILAGMGIFLGLEMIRNKEWPAVAVLAAAAVGWLLGFYISMEPYLGRQLNDSGMFDMYSGLFPPLALTKEAALWYLKYPFNVFANPGGFYFTGLAAALFFIGVVVMWRQHRQFFWMLILPAVITIVAAYFRKYPAFERLILFWSPMLLIFIAAGTAELYQRTRSNVFIGIILAVLCLHPFKESVDPVTTPSSYPEVRETFQFLQQNARPADHLYIYYKARHSWEYYGEPLGIELESIKIGVSSRDAWWRYVDDLQSMRGKDRVWIYFTHISDWHSVDEEEFFIQYLNRIGTQLEHHSFDGTELYLYDLSNLD